MTTPKDDFTKRTSNENLGQGSEDTVGVSKQGGADPTGEYPKRDYSYGPSVNKAARGQITNQLFFQGGDIDVNLKLPPQRPSMYPFNKVEETASGHIIERDDTPGGERILIRHRLGSGVEMRADGTVVISSRKHTVRLSGADETVIIEGNGTMVYKGSLDIDVAGDYNVNVGGDMNVDIAGNYHQRVRNSLRQQVGATHSTEVQGDRDVRVIGDNTHVGLGDDHHVVKNNRYVVVGKQLEHAAGETLIMSSEGVIASSATKINHTATTISVLGVDGSIGGENVQYFGKTYSGAPNSGDNGQDVTFYGTFVGLATEATTAYCAQNAIEAWHSVYADYADEAVLADNSVLAGVANSTGTGYSGPGTSDPSVSEPTYLLKHTYDYNEPRSLPNAAMIGAHLTMSQYGIRQVNVDTDDTVLNKLIKFDDYSGVFAWAPSIFEIRAALREPANLSNGELTTTLISEGRLSPSYTRIVPTQVGRVASAQPSTRFGLDRIGNNPLVNRSKRFKSIQ